MTWLDIRSHCGVLQFYNRTSSPTTHAHHADRATEGTNEYTSCAGLLTASSSAWPNTAVFQLAANGVALNKIVIGKPAIASDAENGFVSTGSLATCVAQAKAQGWSAVRRLFFLVSARAC
jgi:hypothetical protein